MLVLWGGDVSFKRGTPVILKSLAAAAFRREAVGCRVLRGGGEEALQSPRGALFLMSEVPL